MRLLGQALLVATLAALFLVWEAAAFAGLAVACFALLTLLERDK